MTEHTLTRQAVCGEVEAARLVLSSMGVSPAELLDNSFLRKAIPTFAEYIPRVSEAVTLGTRRVY
jgi:hypothetical protein